MIVVSNVSPDRGPSPVPGPVRSWILPIGSGVLVAFGFQPWIRSGLATYSSFDVARVARDFGVDGLFGVLSFVWFLVPVMAAAVLLAAALGRPRIMAAIALVLSVVAVVGGVSAMAVASGAGLASTGAPPAAVVVGVVLGVVATIQVAPARNHRSDPRMVS